jgi:Flp pilus assembly protein TadD
VGTPAQSADPKRARELNRQALDLTRSGDFEQAVTLAREAVNLLPHAPAIHNTLGLAWQGQGELQPAERCYRRAIELDPKYVKAHSNLGNVLVGVQRYGEARDCCRRAIELDPRSASAHNNLGRALAGLGLDEEAADHYRMAIDLDPEHASAHRQLGDALRRRGEPNQAIAPLRRAAQLRPDFVDAHNDLGLALQELGRMDEAIECFETAVGLAPDNARLHRNYSYALLRWGDFQRGWREGEWRWKEKPPCQPPLDEPVWDGKPLEGRTILVHTEQGFGDTIQFIRYLPLVKARGSQTIVCSEPRMMELVRSCSGIDRVVSKREPLPNFDVHTALMSLPAVLGTELSSIPAEVPYLATDPALIDSWAASLKNLGSGFKVGIAWQGNPDYPGDRYRSIPLATFAPLAEIEGVRLISLQKGHGSEQLDDVAFEVEDLGPRLDEGTGAFMETAAVIQNLDLIITSDTAIAHLAGALAAPVWVPLSTASDWRFLMDRQDCPWYPTMRLFRQKTLGVWQGVFEEIQAETKHLVKLRQEP